MTVEPFHVSPPPDAGFAALADAARTGGALGVVLTRCDPDRPIPPHTHTTEDETVVVLSGRCVLTVAGRGFPAAAGDLVFAPRGRPHGIRAIGGPARLLTVLTPAGAEDFVAVLAARPDLDPRTLLALAADHGVQLHLPDPTPPGEDHS